MLDTAVAQLRFAASIVFGVPFAAWSLDRLIDGLLATQREFGAVAPSSTEALGSPGLDEETRRAMQARRFRAQAVRAARETAYYERLFARLGLEPARLVLEDLARLPLTDKEALRTAPDDFVRRTARPYLRSMTTGTTGWPTSTYFSAAELHTIVSLTAISFLLHRDVGAEDVVHIASSARATLGNASVAGACARVGATYYLAGLVEPERTLALLAEPRALAGKKRRASVLVTYPSYLGQLVTCGLRHGYRPADFGLERIAVGGEIVTVGLRDRCRELFGPARIVENYALTELAPLGGILCEAGHLHFEPAHGLVEVHDHATDAAARPGAAGTLVATPFRPFRETTLLLRYDTGDVVRALDGPPTCSLQRLPATSHVLGRRQLAVQHAGGWTYPRPVLEALEALEVVPLPARCGLSARQDGVAVEVVAREDTAGARRAIAASLEAHDVPVRALRLVQDQRQLYCPLPLRGDLREAAFPAPALDGNGDERRVPAGAGGGEHG